MRATIVDQSNIDFIWSSVERFIRSAFTKHVGDETEEDVRELLRLGKAQLWIAHDGRGIKAAAITRLATIPNRRRICFCMACGGEDFDTWIQVGLNEIEKFAKANNCDAVRISGRRGWRKIKIHGYQEPFVILEKTIS